MPTVAMLLGFRVVVYPNDHRPAHVHVIGGGKEGVFFLNCPDGPPELRENFGLSRSDVRRLRTALLQEIERLCEKWEAIHGEG